MAHETGRACKPGLYCRALASGFNDTWAVGAGNACACWAASGIVCCWLLTDGPDSARSAQLPRVESSGASVLQQRGQT